LFQIVHTVLIFILSIDLTLGTEKQLKLEDIEQDNLRNKQAQPQQQQAKPSASDYTGHQQLNYLVQQQQAKPTVSDYTGHQQLNYLAQQQQISLPPMGYLHGLQPQVQFLAPPSGGPVALYLAGSGLAGNYLGITPDVSHQNLPQQIYFPQGGYSGLQFVQVPPSPFIYSHQSASPELPAVSHPPTQKGAPPSPPKANTLPSHTSSVTRSAYQRPSAASTDTNFVYTPQQGYNPIPKELQSYTTIPDTVYQGKEPDFLYDQQPSVSITHDTLKQYNALYQQPKPQKPTLSSGVKSSGASLLKSFSNGARLLTHTSHIPGLGISYSNYRQGPGPLLA
jgi:hypothetical protein